VRRLATTLAALGSVILLAVPSSAAPDRSFTLSSDARSASWSSPVNAGSYVYAVAAAEPPLRCAQDCDETLLRLTRTGTLRLDVTARGPLTAPDVTYLHLIVYRSDAKGSRGKELGSAATPSAHLTLRNLPAGFYLAEVAWREGVSSVDGAATFAPAKRR
jgi:hypothetical protein